MKKNQNRVLLLLHIVLMIYSLSGIFSKKAAGVPFLSVRFLVYYGLIFLILGFYAIGWQQIIKRLPLTTAFANKAVTVVWGIVWGVLFFHEAITPGKILGALMVVIGVVMYARADGAEKEATGE